MVHTILVSFGACVKFICNVLSVCLSLLSLLSDAEMLRVSLHAHVTKRLTSLSLSISLSLSVSLPFHRQVDRCLHAHTHCTHTHTQNPLTLSHTHTHTHTDVPKLGRTANKLTPGQFTKTVHAWPFVQFLYGHVKTLARKVYSIVKEACCIDFFCN